MKFTLTELFYEWTLSIKANPPTKGSVIVRLRDQHLLNDRVRVLPAGEANGPIGRWLSGFNEPGTPDYWDREVTVSAFAKDGTAKVILRRPLAAKLAVNKPRVANFHFLQQDFEGREFLAETPCNVKVEPFDEHANSESIVRHILALATWKYDGEKGPLTKLKINPDVPQSELTGNEVEVSMEVHCANEICDQLQARNLESRRSRQ